MNWKMVATVSLGLVIGLVAWSSLRQSQAQSQIRGSDAQLRSLDAELKELVAQVQVLQKKVEWEYKVVAFVVESDNRQVDSHTKAINKLAAEGWEYVGLLCAGPHPYTDGAGMRVNSGGNVLFKRAKR